MAAIWATPAVARGMKLSPMRPYRGLASSISWPSRASTSASAATARRTSGWRLWRLWVSAGRQASAMRSRPGSRPAAVTRSTGGGLCRSVGCCPATMSSRSAASPTVRASGPPTPSPSKASACGNRDTRPRCGLMPTRLVQAAGIRIEPAPSEPSATGTIPAATAAADPPEDPPGVYSRFQGLRVAPKAGPSVNGHCPSSQALVLPTITAPAARNRRTDSPSPVAGPISPRQPNLVGSPATSVSSLTATGTPSNGSRSPAASLRSASSASACAASARTHRKALRVPWVASILPSALPTSAAEVTSPLASAAARSVSRGWPSLGTGDPSPLFVRSNERIGARGYPADAGDTTVHRPRQEPRRLPVHGYRRDRLSDRVQVEPRQRLGGLRPHRHRRGHRGHGRLIVEADVVGLRVVSTVAEAGEQRVADPGRACGGRRDTGLTGMSNPDDTKAGYHRSGPCQGCTGTRELHRSHLHLDSLATTSVSSRSSHRSYLIVRGG